MEEIKVRETILDGYLLFKLRPNIEGIILDKGHAKAFHKSIVHILFACSSTQRDLELAVLFLSTRIKTKYEDGWVKLKQLFWYIWGGIYLPLNLSPEYLYVTKWFVDTYYMIQNDWRGHTGAMKKLGHGAVLRMYHKNKLKTSSSTKINFVRVHNE